MRFWRPPLYQLELLAYACFFLNLLSGLFVHRVGVAPLAVLLELDAVRIVLLVLLGRIVSTLAFSACKGDQSTHQFSFKLRISIA